jgi:hypothetical protein
MSNPEALGKRNTVNTRISFILVAVAFLWLGVLFPADKALGQQAENTLKNQLVGTWILVSNFTNRDDGSKVDLLGPNPKGILMIDNDDHFSAHEMRSDLPRFGSNSRQGTEAESKAIMLGSIAYFGTYTIDEAAKTLTVHIDACSFPNWNGTDQKKSFTLSKDELTWSDAGLGGRPVYTIWKRAR